MLGRLFGTARSTNSDVDQAAATGPLAQVQIPDLHRDDLSALELDAISYKMLSAALKNPTEIAEALRAILDSYTGPVTPLLDRVAIQLLDSTLRRQFQDNVELLDRVDWLAQKWPHIPAADLYQGAVSFNNGDRASAFASFRRAATAAHQLPRMYIGAYSIGSHTIDDWNASTGSHPFLQDTVTWVVPAAYRSRAVILVGADCRFFVKFAARFYETLRRVDDTIPVHFHVVNWDDECAAILPQHPTVSISSEAYRYVKDYAYFATCRFYRAAEIMKALGSSLYITDIDNDVVAPFRRCRDLKDYACGFRHMQTGNWFPWWSPSAGNTWLANTTEGRTVAKWLRNYIATRFPAHKNAWWFDQLALNEVRHRAMAEGHTVAELSEKRFYISVSRDARVWGKPRPAVAAHGEARGPR